MRRPALAVTVLVMVGALGACGSRTGSTTTAGTPAASTPAASTSTTGAPISRSSHAAAAPGGNRFQVLYHDSVVVFRQAEQDRSGPDPQDADDANRLLGLDDSSPLRFADLQNLHGDRGRFCLVSHDDTYVALSVGRTVTVLFGDGSCTYAARDAAVVGDVFKGRWTKGADLMGHLSLWKLFADKLSAQGEPAPSPSSSEVAQPQGQADPQLLGEVRTFAFSIDRYALSVGHYPRVGPADLVRTVSSGLPVPLGPQTRVLSYRATASGYAMCVADDTSWVRWASTPDGHAGSNSTMTGSTSTMDTGTYSSPAELDRVCVSSSTP